MSRPVLIDCFDAITSNCFTCMLVTRCVGNAPNQENPSATCIDGLPSFFFFNFRGVTHVASIPNRNGILAPVDKPVAEQISTRARTLNCVAAREDGAERKAILLEVPHCSDAEQQVFLQLHCAA